MSGVRIFCNSYIPVENWDHEFVVVNSRLVSENPLPALVSFDLLNPLDNSGNGHKVTKAGGIIKPYGLDFNRANGGSVTDFIANKDSISVLCAVKVNGTDAFNTFLDSRTLNSSTSSGFAVDFSTATQKLRLNLTYPSGANEVVQFPTFVAGEWNILCFTLSPTVIRGENHLGEIITKDFSSPINVGQWASPLLLGKSVTNGTCDGSVGFVAVYDGYWTPDQRKAAIQTGREVMVARGESIS
ncbi:hypothetical protein [Serratia bockelmannii]|uniref:hypothetical protein n=1 Tax=Serratia bockelmannii TaxID=2703793 RepID=UPI00313CC049